MEDLYIKKFWEEESVTFYIHFRSDKAVRQVEISSTGKVLLSEDAPIRGNSMLYDQSLSDLNIGVSDFISQNEFELIWTGDMHG